MKNILMYPIRRILVKNRFYRRRVYISLYSKIAAHCSRYPGTQFFLCNNIHEISGLKVMYFPEIWEFRENSPLITIFGDEGIWFRDNYERIDYLLDAIKLTEVPRKRWSKQIQIKSTNP